LRLAAANTVNGFAGSAACSDHADNMSSSITRNRLVVIEKSSVRVDQLPLSVALSN
jgi:hypothetical protein